MTTGRNGRVLLAWLGVTLMGAGCSSCHERSRPPDEPASTLRSRAPDIERTPESGQQAERVRPAAVAGAWYPGEEQDLERYVDGVLGEAEQADVPGPVIALVAPHAGYAYSGKAAATAYKLLEGQDVRRVIILGVSHGVRFEGASIPDVTHYETPLGRIPLDQDAVRRLRQSPVVKEVDAAHRREHSVEMQLPLLQRVVGDFQLVPLVVGELAAPDYEALAGALAAVVDDATVVVASSDFTHRGDRYSYEVPPGEGSIKERVDAVDQGAIDEILEIDPAGLREYHEKTGATICGIRPIAVLLQLLGGNEEVSGRVVSRYTSGDVQPHEWSSTVSYVAIAFTGEWPRQSALDRARSAGASKFALSIPDRRRLLRLARGTLDASVRAGAYADVAARQIGTNSSLERKAGAFVTLKCELGPDAHCTGKGHDLRGCIGTIAPVDPVYDTVARRAASAALEDPRFPAVTPEELQHIRVEVSVLTPPREVAGPDDIIIGRHGIILSKGYRSATFLPQVAPEQGWDRDATLSHLARKAGLGRDGWREGTSFSVYEAIVFSEGETLD
jgi:hypothetical protein